MQLLIAGGAADPNVLRMVSAATSAGVSFGVASAGVDSIGLDMEEDGVRINGTLHRPHALFARFNVFGYDSHTDTAAWWRYHNWHTALCDALPSTVTLNPMDSHSTKVRNLRLARECGFTVPATSVASVSPVDGICKPVHGGQHTQRIRKGAATPWGMAFCQEYLPGPEYRIYVVGDKSWAFSMQSESLDYRELQDVIVAPVSGLEDETACMRLLMAKLGLRFAAIDMRWGPRGLCFLEINDGPMFAAFDDEVDRQISAEMVRLLCPPR